MDPPSGAISRKRAKQPTAGNLVVNVNVNVNANANANANAKRMGYNVNVKAAMVWPLTFLP